MIGLPAQPRIAIIAYGSLIHSPGEALAALVERREPCRTPFSVEYGRQSVKWGGGPVLTVDPRGAPVDGQLLHLRAGIALGRAVDVLAAREGIPGAEGILAVRSDGDGVVLTCALPRNLDDAEMSPAALARRAAASMANGSLNGVAYLSDAVGAGVRTPLTDRYVAELVGLAGCADLQEVESRLVALREREIPKE